MLRLPPSLLFVVAALAACGTSPDPSGDPDSGTATGDVDGGQGGETTPDGGGAASEPVRTATITLGTTTRTVTPAVRRGLISPPDALYFGAEARSASPTVTLSCLPAAPGDKGGRVVGLATDAVFEAGGILCSQGGGGLVDARIATRQALLAACAQKSTCTVNLYDAWMAAIWGCSSARPDLISVNYSCDAQRSFSPAMVFDSATADLQVTFSGLDGAGSASCAERGLKLTVPGHTVDGCALDLTTRTGADLAGVLTATLRDASANAVPLTVDFRHERNTLRPNIQFLTEGKSCASASVTHTTRTAEGVTTDTLRTSGPFTCQPGGTTMESPPTVEVAIRRPTEGATASLDCSDRVEVRVNDRTTQGNGGCRGAAMDEGPFALRAWLGNVSTCSATNECVSEGTMLLNYDFSTPAAPAP